MNTERLGFDGVLTPVGSQCTDPWIATAALIGAPAGSGSSSPCAPARPRPPSWPSRPPASSLSGGRVVLNVVTGGDPEEQRRYGDWLDHDARYARTDEFLTVIRGRGGLCPSTSTATTSTWPA